MKSEHDANLALAQRVTSPRHVWDDELQVVSRNELRLAIGLGLAGLLVGLAGAWILIFGV